MNCNNLRNRDAEKLYLACSDLWHLDKAEKLSYFKEPKPVLVLVIFDYIIEYLSYGLYQHANLGKCAYHFSNFLYLHFAGLHRGRPFDYQSYIYPKYYKIILTIMTAQGIMSVSKKTSHICYCIQKQMSDGFFETDVTLLPKLTVQTFLCFPTL